MRPTTSYVLRPLYEDCIAYQITCQLTVSGWRISEYHMHLILLTYVAGRISIYRYCFSTMSSIAAMPAKLHSLRVLARSKDAKVRASFISLVVAVFLLLRSRRNRKTDHSPEESDVARALQMVYEPNSDGSKTLLVPFRGRVKKVSCLFYMVLSCWICKRSKHMYLLGLLLYEMLVLLF